MAVELLDDEYGAINAIEGSPFFLRMIPSRTFPGQCQVFSSFNATASAPLEIVVQARDEYGNNRTELEPLYSDSPLDAVIPESILSPTMRVLRLFNAPAGAYAATSLRLAVSTFMVTVRYLPLAAVFFVALMRSHASCMVSSFSTSIDSWGMTIIVPP